MLLLLPVQPLTQVLVPTTRAAIGDPHRASS
jgi:hypothetical protein